MSTTCWPRPACGTGPSWSPARSGSAWPGDLLAAPGGRGGTSGGRSPGRPGDAVDLADPVRAPVHRQGRGPGPGQRWLAEVPDRCQAEEFAGVPTARADPDQPDAGRVVLDLVAAGRVARAPFVDHEHPPQAAGAQAGHPVSADDLGDVVELDRGHPALRVPQAGGGPAEHVDAAVGAAGPGEPRIGRAGEPPMIVF